MKRSFIQYFFLIVAAAALCGCGIDTYVYLYPVTQLLNIPSSDNSHNYFSFRTSDEKNENAYGFKGFEIYYRIYNDNSIRSSDVSEIYTNNENNPTTALTYLVNTKKYTRMVYEGRETEMPLIPGASTNRDVTIRLTSVPGYDPRFSVGGSSSLGVPKRCLNEGTVYELFDYNVINKDDADVRYSSSAGTDAWYVQAYVVACGYDDSLAYTYSELFSLQYVTISP